MQLHEDKFELILHRSTPDASLLQLPFVTYETVSYSISCGDKIVSFQTVRDLGVTVQSMKIYRGPYKSLLLNKSAWDFSVFKTREHAPMLALYKSLVRSIMEYCCPLWSPSKVGKFRP